MAFRRPLHRGGPAAVQKPNHDRNQIQQPRQHLALRRVVGVAEETAEQHAQRAVFMQVFGRIKHYLLQVVPHARLMQRTQRTKYNEALKRKDKREILIIHGYGSNKLGHIPILARNLRVFLSKNKDKLSYRLSINPGVTYVTPISKLD